MPKPKEVKNVKNGVCLKCDSTNVVGNVSTLQATRAPQVGRLLPDFRAWICCDCGYLEHYAHHPKTIGRAVDEHVAKNPRSRIGPIRVSKPGPATND